MEGKIEDIYGDSGGNGGSMGESGVRKQLKAPSRKNIEADCYALIQVISLLQDPFFIIPDCGNPSEVGHHLFQRGNLGTAFHPDAVRGVCNFHHAQAHAKPAWFRDVMIGLIGGMYFVYQRLANTVVPFMDFSAKRAELRGIVARLERRAIS